MNEILFDGIGYERKIIFCSPFRCRKFTGQKPTQSKAHTHKSMTQTTAFTSKSPPELYPTRTEANMDEAHMDEAHNKLFLNVFFTWAFGYLDFCQIIKMHRVRDPVIGFLNISLEFLGTNYIIS